MRQTVFFNGKKCLVYAEARPKLLLVQLLHQKEQEFIDGEVEGIRKAVNVSFAFVAIVIEDWHFELAPWADPCVSCCKEAGEGAVKTLNFITENLVPCLYNIFGRLPIVLGGYSLGGLFALWAASKVSCFDAVAAASPSVWLNGWMRHTESHPVNVKDVYLSLGDQEEHVRNRFFKKVGVNIRSEYELLKVRLGSCHCTLEWHRGGHFVDADTRTARAFAWCVNQMASE